MCSSASEMHGEAERWFVRLQAPDCSDAQRAACERWRAESPANEAAFKAVEAIWQRSLDLADDPVLAEALRDAERHSPSSWGARPRFWLVPALVVVVALVVVIALVVAVTLIVLTVWV